MGVGCVEIVIVDTPPGASGDAIAMAGTLDTPTAPSPTAFTAVTFAYIVDPGTTFDVPSQTSLSGPSARNVFDPTATSVVVAPTHELDVDVVTRYAVTTTPPSRWG